MNYFVNGTASGYDTYVIPLDAETKEIKVCEKSICSSIIDAANTFMAQTSISAQPKSCTIVSDGKIVNIILFTINPETLRTEFLQLGKVFKMCEAIKAKKIAVICENTPDQFSSHAELVKTFELPTLVNYKFDAFLSKSTKTEMPEVDFYFTEAQGANAEAAMVESIATATGACITRDAVNYPTSYMSPQIFANLVEAKGKEFGFETEIFDKTALEELGAVSLLAVGAGSKNTPTMSVMRYNGAPESSQKYAIVGKGIMFDSGGYSLKPKMGMVTMHTDMGGGAAVLGAMCTAVAMKLKINLVAIVPAAENLIGENAYLPGTIIGSLLGRTTEVISTDGEGRLVLCDGLTYAWQKEKATHLIDIATLTGSAVVSVGNKSSVGITTCENFWETAEIASANACEKIWRLDLDEELRDNLKSFRADSKNTPTGGKPGGSILGALFLRPFTNNLPWLHIDMSPVAWSTSEMPTGPKGATGYGVSLLFNLLKGLEEK